MAPESFDPEHPVRVLMCGRRPHAYRVFFTVEIAHLAAQDRASQPGMPEGWTPVTADGQQYEADFVQVAVNVLRKPGTDQNELLTQAGA